MWNRLRSVLCGSALFLGFALTSANAADARLVSFAFSCDGLAKVVNLNAGGLGNSVARFVQGAEIVVFDNPDSLSFAVLSALSDPTKTLLTLGKGGRRATNLFVFSVFQTNTSPSGVVPFTLTGSCLGGGMVQGLVTIDFFS